MIGVNTNHELECFCACRGARRRQLNDEFAEFEDLEPDLAAALSTADREAADKNCLEFGEHVAQVGSSGGLTEH